MSMTQNVNWQETNQGLYRQFEFVGFLQAFAFMTEVAEVAEQAQHHPKWTNEWNKVEIWLLSHDDGNVITAKDRQLAVEINKVFETHKGKHENN